MLAVLLFFIFFVPIFFREIRLGISFSLKTNKRKPGPSCLKLMTSLVNDSLKFTSSDTQIC